MHRSGKTNSNLITNYSPTDDVKSFIFHISSFQLDNLCAICNFTLEDFMGEKNSIMKWQIIHNLLHVLCHSSSNANKRAKNRCVNFCIISTRSNIFHFILRKLVPKERKYFDTESCLLSDNDNLIESCRDIAYVNTVMLFPVLNVWGKVISNYQCLPRRNIRWITSNLSHTPHTTPVHHLQA